MAITEYKFPPRCPECKGLNVQFQAWVKYNPETKHLDVIDDDAGGYEWCEDCDMEIHASWEL